MNADLCRRLMQEMLDEKLYRHSLGVAEAALSLAESYGADTRKAYLAGMIHDYGKRYTKKELLHKAHLLGLTLDKITRQERRLLHAPVGAALAEVELKVYDPAVLRAVASHTTGRRGMTLLEKVVYLADFIEKGRNFDGVDLIRDAARTNIDRALLIAVNQTIKSVLNRDLLLHPRSVAFRNNLLYKTAGKKHK
jgi:predicted HD superfamily hydrolase involved in NAD metabolism